MVRSTLVALVLSVVVGASVRGGELTPPAGPIAGTDATLLNAQWTTLPFTITQPGTYRLTSNLTGVAGQHGIVIDTDNVTIDLNGFTLVGVPGSDRAITATRGTTRSGITVENGFVESWDGGGIDGNRIEFDGQLFRTEFVDTSVRHVTVTSIPGGNAIGCHDNSQVVHCIVRDSAVGVHLEKNGLIDSTSVWDSTSTGMLTADECVVRDSSVRFVSGTGIASGNFGLVRGCSVVGPGTGSGFGITAGTSVIIRECRVSKSATGITVDPGTLIENCTAFDNDNFGIVASENVTVRGCAVTGNAGDGIRGSGGADAANVIESNTVNDNGLWGINLMGTTGNFVYRNKIFGNGSGTINAPGSDAPISASSVGAGPFDNIAN
ncbi:MAG: right-handed parallel beta-helix repeat-containing protein [Phycisphaerales bacterium JB043]